MSIWQSRRLERGGSSSVGDVHGIFNRNLFLRISIEIGREAFRLYSPLPAVYEIRRSRLPAAFWKPNRP